MLSHLRYWVAVRRPLTVLLSSSSNNNSLTSTPSNLQLTRSRELILNVLSTVPSPREARKFIDSVSGQETLRTRREFEEQQAQLASSQAPHGLVAGEFLHSHAARAPAARTLALVCTETLGSGKLLAQMQRLGVIPVVLPLGRGDYREAVGRAHALADMVDGEGGRAVPISGGVLLPGGVAAESVAEAVANGIIPVVAPVVVDEGQRIGVVDHRCVAALAGALAGLERAGSLSVARLIYLGDCMGITSGGVVRRLVNLEEDYEQLACGRMEVVRVMRQCLSILAPTTVGIVASAGADPSLVLKGLLSERPPSTLLKRAGAGPPEITLLRHGFRIQRHSSLETCDAGRLQALLESSFGRTLDAGEYFDRLRRCEGGIQVIVAGEYQGAVIVTHEMGRGRLPYLDKFAVLPEVQGTGMADILWDELRAACPSCLWRSRADNGVNRWYFDRSNGHRRGEKWVFFWYQGEKPQSLMEVAEGMEVAKNIPASFL